MRKALNDKEAIRVRFWPNVRKGDSDVCWPWTGPSDDGYGYMSFRGRTMKSHRVSAIIHGLDVRPKMHVDHMCMNRLCVNPNHLRVVTQIVNSLENSNALGAVNARKTHCPKGHPLVPGNLVKASWKKGWRDCLTCNRERTIERDRKRRETLKDKSNG